jgi:hypothetical protein
METAIKSPILTWALPLQMSYSRFPQADVLVGLVKFVCKSPLCLPPNLCWLPTLSRRSANE